MARALATFRVSDQAGVVQPNQSVLILDEDGSSFGQTLYVASTGGETLTNPLTSNDVGLIVAYADTPQRALARVTLDGIDYDVPFDFEDDPADVLSAPFAVAGLTPGAANQALLTNGAGTAAAWGDSPQSLLTTTGDLLVASAANTPARLAIGTARQALVVNAGGTGLAYGTSLMSLLTATGSLPYASSANTPAELTVGSNGQVLTLAGGIPSWANATVSVAPAAVNLVTNGTFAVNQRAMPTTDNAYCLDRWRLLLGAATAATVTQETSDLPSSGARTGIQLTVGAANNNKFGVFTILEGKDIWHMRGGAVSLQFKAKATAGISDMRAAVVQWTGTEDNGGTAFPDPISVWGATATVPTYTGSWANANTPANLSPTTSWATYTITNISISSSATNLAVFIWSEDTTTTTTSDVLRITDVQMEAGATASAFQRMRQSETLARCERYFTKTFPQGTAPALSTASFVGALHYTVSVAGIAVAAIYWQFPVTLRATPTGVTTYNPDGANSLFRNANDSADSGAIILSQQSDRGLRIGNTQIATDGIGDQLFVHCTVDAEL